MEKKKHIEWCSYDYSAHTDKDKIYCRMANKVMKFNSSQCFNCPLWNGDCREVHCCYYGPYIAEDMKPSAMKKLMDGLIAVGYDTEFPTFVVDERINFGGRVTPKEWTSADFQKIEQAYQLAAKAHKGQVRKGTNIPYIVHPVETSIIAFELSNDVNVIIGAILHDVVEDTAYSLYDIINMFGDEVAELVAYESEDKRKDLPPAESWKIRKKEFLSHLSTVPLEAKVITLSDKLSNMRALAQDYESKGDDVWAKFNQKDKREHEWYYREIADLTKQLETTDRHKEYRELLNIVFAK